MHSQRCTDRNPQRESSRQTEETQWDTMRDRMSLSGSACFIEMFSGLVVVCGASRGWCERQGETERRETSPETNPTHSRWVVVGGGGPLIAQSTARTFTVWRQTERERRRETEGQRKETFSAQTKAACGCTVFTSCAALSTRTRRIIQAFLQTTSANNSGIYLAFYFFVCFCFTFIS